MSDFLQHCTVAIIGSGPAGLSTAIALKKQGVDDIVVLERFSEAGGNPRHCGHSPFGFTEFKRVYLGPAYARKMVQTAQQLGIRIELNTSVVELGKNGLLTLSREQGMQQLKADKVVLATGIREKPRAPRLVSGQRPLGIMTTGALQSMVYLSHKKPFKRPVIVGTELVSFSAIGSCRHAGIKPVAMLEQNSRVTAPLALQIYPRVFGVDVLTGTQLLEIEGKEKVTGVKVIQSGGVERHIDCDGVIFSGQFTPESSLARLGHLDIDPLTQGPVVDQFGRCSDAAYFAAGNVLRPVETAGWCWREGERLASSIKTDLTSTLPDISTSIPVSIQTDQIKYIVPQRITLTGNSKDKRFQLRLNCPARGQLEIHSGENLLLSKHIHSLPERRILMPMPYMGGVSVGDELVVGFRS
jgi:NADPH-dependent 2,4-dienoyl-CoA reductase/sulfur reductase-like enzyme